MLAVAVSNPPSFSPAQFTPLRFSTVPHELIKCCVERGVARDGIVMIVIYSTCIQSDGRLRCVGREEMMRRSGLNQRMVKYGIESLRDAGIIEPCMVMRHGALQPDSSYTGHIAQYRIAPDVWATIPHQPASETGGSSASDT